MRLTYAIPPFKLSRRRMGTPRPPDLMISPQVIPVSAVLATGDRAPIFLRTLRSLAAQNILPAELIVVDCSKDDATRIALSEWERENTPQVAVRWFKAEIRGAASQRNQGIREATRDFIWFFDDDILFRGKLRGPLVGGDRIRPSAGRRERHDHQPALSNARANKSTDVPAHGCNGGPILCWAGPGSGGQSAAGGPRRLAGSRPGGVA